MNSLYGYGLRTSTGVKMIYHEHRNAYVIIGEIHVVKEHCM